MSKERAKVNTTIDTKLMQRVRTVIFKLENYKNKKIHINDLLEEGLECILTKYEKEVEDIKI